MTCAAVLNCHNRRRTAHHKLVRLSQVMDLLPAAMMCI